MWTWKVSVWVFQCTPRVLGQSDGVTAKVDSSVSLNSLSRVVVENLTSIS